MKKEIYYVINSNQEIRKIYYQLRQISKYIKEKEKEGSLILPGFSNLVCDIYCSLYMANPKVKTIDEIDPKNFINLTILDGLIVNPSFESIREKTKFSKAAALWATEMFVDKLLKSLNKKKNDFKRFNKLNKDLDKEIIKRSLEEKKTGFFFNLVSFIKNLFNKQGRKERAVKVIKNNVSKMAAKETNKILKNINTINKAVGICNGWELEENSIERLSYHKKIELADKIKNSPRLQELAKIIGQMRQMALFSHYSKIYELSQEVYNVIMGDDLLKMHPVEMANLSHPSFQYDFYQRLINKKILQYEFKEPISEKKRKGSIIACIDTSLSMCGKNEIYSKAIAIGLLEIARVEKRNFIGILFGRKGKVQTFVFNNEDVEVIKDNENIKLGFLDGLFEFTVTFMGGGTDFETPLNTAISFRKKTEFNDADLVFITDDICTLSNEFLQHFNLTKKKYNLRLYGVLMGPKFQKPGIMKKFCDEIINYHEINDDVAKIIFEKVNYLSSKNKV
ncbi:MAG: hypothetical protein PHX78_00490 [bacterium]|nr:hypothetical protein [bacterium]